MLLWIVIGAVVLAIAGWAFWPGRRGIADGEICNLKRRSQGDVENYDNPSGPNFGGPF